MKILSRKIIIALIIAGAIALGIYARFFFARNADFTQNTAEKAHEYRNVARGFSFQYPPEGLSATEHDEGDGTYTIVFDDMGGKSFQIFFTPYVGDTITQSRMLKDIPSGTFTAPIEIIIGGGTHALAFFSTGPLGEMREVWFIKDGFLYEVTTYRELDGWLSAIMATWKFSQ